MSLSDRAAAWRTAKRWLYFFHRWTGIILCLLFAIWFMSGVVMMYVPFPSFRPPERIASTAAIDWTQVKVGPNAALARLNQTQFPSEMRIGMAGGEPVYHFITADGRHAVSARNGQEIHTIGAGRAGEIAAALGHAPVASIVAVDRDQWVVTGAFAKMAPFWKVRLADDADTEFYVVQKTGEVVQNTTAHERFWNWLGAVPHWIYFETLRVYQEPWRQTVLWTSGIGIFGAIAGLWVGLLRMRLTARYKSGSVSPYRGWMKWHHIIGMAGGVTLITWVFSGWLSMNPWGGFRDGDTKHVAALYSMNRVGFPRTDMASLAASADGSREIRFAYVGGHPVMTALGGGQGALLLDGASARPALFTRQQIETIARAAMPGARLISTERIDRYDRYWYGTGNPRSDARPLPIFRLMFDDPARTWLHIDPATGELLGQLGSGRRTYRWLFAALHSFDFPWLLYWRPVRDGLMWLFSAAGLCVSVSGIIIGWRRVVRKIGASE